MEPMRFLVKQIESSNRVKGLLISGQINADESVSLMPSGQQAYILLIEKEANYHQSINAKAELLCFDERRRHDRSLEFPPGICRPI